MQPLTLGSCWLGSLRPHQYLCFVTSLCVNEDVRSGQLLLFKTGYFLSDVMTHTTGTQAAIGQNNKSTKRADGERIPHVSFPETSQQRLTLIA